MTVYENIEAALLIRGISKVDRVERIDRLLRWTHIEGLESRYPFELSGGQQQRLCIARTIAVEPQIILMDEPCSALDPIATSKIEDLMSELAKEYTIIIVTHSMQQAARVSQRTAYFHLGNLIEYGDTKEIFVRPKDTQTEAYISGKIG